MTEVQRVQVPLPIAGVRLHARSPEPTAPAAAKVRWLRSLGEREKQRAADAAALPAFSISVS